MVTEITLADEIARLTDSQPIEIVCAWCPDFVPDASGMKSHGMCPKCVERMHAELDTEYRRP
jgi:hypothetical protein